MPKATDSWKPWKIGKQIRESLDILFHGLASGWASIPYVVIFISAKYAYKTYWRGPKKPKSPGLHVGGTQTDADGFAIYGQVRVSGTSIIP